MSTLKVYDLSVDEKFKKDAEEQGKKLGWSGTAFTSRPAIKVKGLMYSLETRDLFYSDSEKMRLAAPLIIPMENFRKGTEKDENGKLEPDYKTRFTPEFIEDVQGQLMSDPDRLKDFFNLEHSEEKVPAYLRELWIVEDPETDKSYKTYGVKVPKGTLFAVVQVTDRDYFEKLKESDVSGFSIEGFWGFDLKASEDVREYGDVILLNDANEMLVLKRTDEDEIEPGKYSLPGGKIEEGEDSKTGALRELKEETGIELDECKEVEAIQNEDETISYYYTGRTSKDPVLSKEHTAFKWIKPEEFGEIDFIFGQNERFKQLYEKAINLNSDKMADIKITDGEHEIDGKIYVFKDGVPVEVKEKTNSEEMAEETAEEDKEKKVDAEEMAEEEEEEGAPEVKNLTPEDVTALIQKTVQPMIDEAMKAVIDEFVKKEDKEEANEENFNKEEKYSDKNGDDFVKGAAKVFDFVK